MNQQVVVTGGYGNRDDYDDLHDDYDDGMDSRDEVLCAVISTAKVLHTSPFLDTIPIPSHYLLVLHPSDALLFV